jgi:hypothetical protein
MIQEHVSQRSDAFLREFVRATQALLHRSPQCAVNSLREFNCDEELRRIEVVLAGLVDDPKLTMSSGITVGNRRVELAPLERYLVSIVPEAENQWSSW